MKFLTNMNYVNPRVKVIQEQAIRKANSMFNPSFNQHTEELTGEPSDRDSYDYAGVEKEWNTYQD